MKIVIRVLPEEEGRTLYTFLLGRQDMSKRLINRMKHDYRIHVNGEPHRTNYLIQSGDVIELYVDIEKQKTGLEPENLSLEIIYEDDSIIAINKRPNLIVHPVSKHQTGTLAHGVAYLFEKQGLSTIIRPVNRLDKDTSGIILFAKNSYIQESLIRQMKKGDIEKEYIAIVHGCIFPQNNTIQLPIARKEGSIMNREVNPEGKLAITKYQTIDSNHDASFIKLKLETGRTHQIRVHLSHIGFPIIGDTLYDPDQTNNYGINRQALHSNSTTFIHPLSKQVLSLNAPIPKDMYELLSNLQLKS